MPDKSSDVLQGTLDMIVLKTLALFCGSRLMRSMLFGVQPRDSISFLPALFGVIALAASIIPARRAAALDPIVAVRYE